MDNLTTTQPLIKLFSIAKIYPDFTKISVFKQPYDIRESGWELLNGKENTGFKPITKESDLDRSIRRSRTVIRDLALCNNFEYFATFTFAKDRTNLSLLSKRMGKWLENQKITSPDLKYIAVPELHADNQALHFHALIANFQTTLRPSATRKTKRIMYNIPAFTHGFTTAIEIDNQAKTANYLSKYLTKNKKQNRGKKRYWASRNLIRPKVIINPELSKISKHLLELFDNEQLTVYKLDPKINLQLI